MAKKKIRYVFGADVTELERGLKRVEYKLGKLSANAQRFGSAMTRNVTAPLVGLGALAVREAVKFESAFARVRKSVGGTEAELKAMEQGIIEMSKTMPTAAADIALVAATAGQLGIQRQNILGFTKSMIQLGETSNLAGEEGAAMMAKFANTTLMNQKHFDRLGSTVVALGNSLATTERDIMEMAGRFGAAGKVVGMTEAQILAFAGSLSSVGVEAQAGGTAFEKLFFKLDLATREGGDAIKDFAVVSGLSIQEFIDLFQRDAAGAIIKFIEGLASLKGTGLSAVQVLERMGITEVRQRNALIKSTIAVELFSRSQKTANEAWQKNNELQEKTAIFYKTTEKRLAIVRNQISATGREIGNTLTPSLMVAANRVADVTKAFSDLSPELKTSIVNWGLTAAAIGPMILIFSKITSGAAGALKALRNLAIFLSANAAVFSGAAAALAFLVNADSSAKGIESLSERRGLGLNESGRSKELADLRAEQDALALAKAMEAYDKAAVSRQGGKGGYSPTELGLVRQENAISPETQKIIDSFKAAGAAASKEGKAAKRVYDELAISLAKSMGISNEEAQQRLDSARKIGEQTSSEIQAITDRNELLEESKNIAAELNHTFASEEASNALEALRLQLDIGNIGLEQYREALTKIREQFAMFPGAVEQIDSAMKALDISIQASTRTLGSFVREAETALREKLIEVPDLISSAFAGAIAYGEDLGDSLRRLAQDIAYAVIKATLLKSIFGLFGFADGGVISGGNIVPFARGGIVDRPTIFPMAHGMGLMGEAGPEAVMPLTRTTGGELGVQAEGGGETHITMNINAVDSRSFVEMMRTNRASVENIVVENIMKNGTVRSAMRGLA